MAYQDAFNDTGALINVTEALEGAAEMLQAASQQMLAATRDSGTARERELTVEAVETGFLRALRREALSGEQEMNVGGSLLRIPKGGISGTGYGRMGASVTGQGGRAQTYGAIGGAIGYAVGGPIGGFLGGMLGGWLGGDDDEEKQSEEEELRRQWLNNPLGFEVEAYLYNLTRVEALKATTLTPPTVPYTMPSPRAQSGQAVVVNMQPGAVQITGQGEEAGEEAARAFAGALGRALQLNSVVVPAAGMGVF